MVYSDLLSKLSLSSRRCFAGLTLLLCPALSFVDTELERDISLPSSVSARTVSNDFGMSTHVLPYQELHPHSCIPCRRYVLGLCCMLPLSLLETTLFY